MVKIYIDKKEVTSAEINSRQDFNKILASLPTKKKWINPWFYGAVGLSSIIGGISLYMLLI
jgi:hypothetical protein